MRKFLEQARDEALAAAYHLSRALAYYELESSEALAQSRLADRELSTAKANINFFFKGGAS